MKQLILIIGAGALFGLTSPSIAQDAVRGAATGAAAGAVVGGPVGAAAGAVVGGVTGGLRDDERPRFRDYVVGEHRRSYKWGQPVRVGGVLPDDGVTYYSVPQEYGVSRYRYTVVDGETVLVDPETHRIVQVIE